MEGLPMRSKSTARVAPFDYSLVKGFYELPHPSDGRRFVYMIKNLVTGERYIGATRKPQSRIITHRNQDSLTGHAMAKYGLSAFEVSILFEGTDDEAFNAEVRLISEIGTLTSQGGYNIQTGGPNPPILKGADHPSFGKRMSPESVAVMRAKLTGRKISAQASESMSKARMGLGTSWAKLTPQIVREIRTSSVGCKELAAFYNVHPATVWEARMRRTWKNVE
jgi:group I intron endonuclease